MRFSSFVLFLLVFCVVFELSVFDRSLQDGLVEKSSLREGRVGENRKVLDFFSSGVMDVNMSEAELSHMSDVKRLNSFFKLFIWLLVVLFGVAVFFCSDFAGMLSGLWLPLAVFCIMLVLCVFFPSFCFSAFHAFFFPQGNYLFPAGSFLISLYPEAYFFRLFYSIALRTVLVAAVLIAAGEYYERFQQKSGTASK